MLNSKVAAMLVVTSVLFALSGCTPRTLVKKNPCAKDNGVRYYRPKPYLMIKPATNKNGEPVAGYVSIETTTLPDFSEEYSIHVKSGWGVNNTSITLEDGWNLTGLNVKLDSQFDENLEAAAEFMKAVPTGGGSFAESKTMVRGTNIPFGLYEAIIGKYNCRKRLYGFRYVGFLPYSSCPVEFGGCQPHSCDSSVLYGLVFDKEAGVMVFKELPRIPVENANPVRVATPTATEPDLPDADGNGDVNVGIEDAIHR